MPNRRHHNTITLINGRDRTQPTSPDSGSSVNSTIGRALSSKIFYRKPETDTNPKQSRITRGKALISIKKLILIQRFIAKPVDNLWVACQSMPDPQCATPTVWITYPLIGSLRTSYADIAHRLSTWSCLS